MEAVASAAYLASFDLAIVAATISILAGGILFGTGIGFGLRRLKLLGVEEIGQGIISAAMVGALIAFSALLDSSVSSLVPSAGLPTCPQIASPSSSPYSFYACHLSSLSGAYQSLSSQLYRSSDIAGFAGSLVVDASVVSVQPFFALQETSRQLSGAASSALAASSLAAFEAELARLVLSSALAVFLPAGLILRTFFATRKLGAAAMAIAISAYAVYPLLFLYTFQESRSGQSAQEALEASSAFNSDFASLPLLELDRASSVRDKIGEMSGGDFPGKLQPVLSTAYRSHSLSYVDLVLLPLISLAISSVAAFELYHLISAPLALPYFSSI